MDELFELSWSQIPALNRSILSIEPTTQPVDLESPPIGFYCNILSAISFGKSYIYVIKLQANETNSQYGREAISKVGNEGFS